MVRDEELMLAAGKGDLEAFEQIVLRHQASVWNTAYRFLGDRTESEDVAQDVFLNLLDAAGHYRPTASFRTYLYRVVTHLCLDRVRKKKPIYTDTLPDILDDSLSAPEQLQVQQRDQAVRKALEKLGGQQRMAIILKYYENLSYREISVVMDVSEKAVERLLSRGRASLEKNLKKYFNPELFCGGLG
ncbi:MAG: sigma-70 family RNA polymerase sigma factor [Planctomycetes bacterium]|nr:sigma-70 family RNA polymerase sigma factor [Planctomycetota bacterium]